MGLNAEDWTAIATVIIALFTVVLAYVSNRQAKLTKEALVADHRAFVFSQSFAQYWTLNKDTNKYDWRFRPVLQNSGNSPTKNMTMHAECVLRDSPLPEDFDFNYNTTEIGRGLLPPKASTQGGLVPRLPNSPIKAEDIVDVQTNKKFLYMWGWVKYNDVFPDTPQHITRYCWLIVPKGDPLSFAPNDKDHALAFDFIHHPQGNCADGECDV